MSDLAPNPKKTSDLFIWLATCAGGWSCFVSANRVDLQLLDIKFVILATLTLLLSSRIVVPIPRLSSHLSVSATLIFLALLLFGGEVAVLLAGTEAILSSFRFFRDLRAVLFNWAGAVCSTFVASMVLDGFFADRIALHQGLLSPRFILALSVVALVQYVLNTGMLAVGHALKDNQPIWKVWRKHYAGASITYFAGAFAAAALVELTVLGGLFAVILTLPIIAAVVFSYRTYLKEIEAVSAQAEQAKHHVLELSRHIAEQESIREQSAQIEKLSALGELASGVAHDFNNTLAGILGRAQLMLRTNDPAKLSRGLNIIIKAAEDGGKTVKRIQDFARQRRDHDFEPVAVDQVLFEVSEITRPHWKDKAAAAGIHINLDVQIRSKSKVMGDQAELREVLVNMVFNAVDAMPEGGQLTLSAEDIDDSVVISIADTGFGMAPEIRSRIFDPFFTTKGRAGMGLGLAVSFGIIRRHEGTITVRSEVLQGTTFTITLPAVNPEEGSVITPIPTELTRFNGDVAACPTKEQRSNRLRVLVVDDEQNVRELLRELLESEHCAVSTAADGREALALFASQGFDAVFTDVGMPGMSGWELASAIRRQNKELPIAIITGWGEAVASNEQREAGVNWVIAKPFSARRIFELVREIVDQREAAATSRKPSMVAA